MNRFLPLVVGSLCCIGGSTALASTIVFFDSSQVATPVATGVTSDTVSSEGYLFTYTRDKLFTGGIGLTEPIGRPVRVAWPQGLEAQAVTAGPNPGKAKITIERVDGDIFDLTAFAAQLLANTAGAGGSFEVVPFLNGEEVFNDPLVFNATGNSGNTFSYDTSPNPLGSTALLIGFDKYTIDLYVDFALVGLTVEGAPVPEPSSFAIMGLGVVALALARSQAKWLPRTTPLWGRRQRTRPPVSVSQNGLIDAHGNAHLRYEIQI